LQDDIGHWKPKLFEGKTYSICNLSVAAKDPPYKMPWKLKSLRLLISYTFMFMEICFQDVGY
jgi:hypothetical protein